MAQSQITFIGRRAAKAQKNRVGHTAAAPAAPALWEEGLDVGGEEELPFQISTVPGGCGQQ